MEKSFTCPTFSPLSNRRSNGLEQRIQRNRQFQHAPDAVLCHTYSLLLTVPLGHETCKGASARPGMEYTLHEALPATGLPRVEPLLKWNQAEVLQTFGAVGEAGRQPENAEVGIFWS